MNRREMKKKILVFALEQLLLEATGSDTPYYELGTHILDKDIGEITDAEFNRYVKLLREMVDNARSKID
tara:strand:- start:454 stop:660 length:207 start_codon:yes stop_codon:yes gene_type:complete